MKTITRAAIATAILCVPALHAATSGTGVVSVTIGAEASITVITATTTLASGTAFADYTGTTSLSYKIRTTGSGTGTITALVTSDFSPAAGPSVGSPLSGADALKYTCTVASSGTACSGSQTASTTTATSVATFGANAHSTATGDSASVAWTLPNDPAYPAGSYSATVTYTISST